MRADYRSLDSRMFRVWAADSGEKSHEYRDRSRARGGECFERYNTDISTVVQMVQYVSFPLLDTHTDESNLRCGREIMGEEAPVVCL
jgi:hypothetical protein